MRTWDEIHCISTKWCSVCATYPGLGGSQKHRKANPEEVQHSLSTSRNSCCLAPTSRNSSKSEHLSLNLPHTERECEAAEQLAPGRTRPAGAPRAEFDPVDLLCCAVCPPPSLILPIFSHSCPVLDVLVTFQGEGSSQN